MNYYERHIGDYLKDTAHLSLLEHGVYTRLLDVYYTREGPIPAADAARLIGVRTREEKAALASVLAEFFVPVDGHHAQDRCDREIARFQDKRGKAKASAKARWGAQRSQSEGNANASTDPPADAMRTDMRTHDERNATREHAGARPPARPQSPVTRPNTSEAKLPRGRATRLPTEWEPGETGFAFAASQGLTNGVAQAELAKFRDFWTAKSGQDATKADWQATWRNWVRKAVEMRGGSAAPPPNPSAWHETLGGVKAKGLELGIPYSSADACKPFDAYKARVIRAAQETA